MNLPSSLISEFVKVTNDATEVKTESTHYGTIVEHENSKYVRIDGSDLLTPVITTTSYEDGQRVIVMIKDHTAVVTGNISSPAPTTKEVDDKIGTVITEVEILVADKVSTKDFDAQTGRIDTLVSDNVTIRESLTAQKATIDDLEADNVKINETLTAQKATITDLETSKLSAKDADLKYATIVELEATDAEIRNLEADYGSFKQLTADELEAHDAAIGNLETGKLSAKDAEIMYANIDFANIKMAAVEKLFSEAGIIKNLTTSSGTITGELVGVTIKGDLIEGGTVVAEKLVVKGTDGIYYKLNTDGVTTESEQTEYNSLNGSVITAKSITATKISVTDLVAFGATIGGFHITTDSIYSGAKSTVDNTTRGIYLDNSGQTAFGDGSNYLKYYKDKDGRYKLEIAAESIKIGASNKNVQDFIQETVNELSIGARNLIRNSKSMIFESYGFMSYSTSVLGVGILGSMKLGE